MLETLKIKNIAVIDTADGERLRAWHLQRPDALAQVVYFHGNGGNLSLWSDVLVELWHRQLDVIAIDYRGYGLSTGRRTRNTPKFSVGRVPCARVCIFRMPTSRPCAPYCVPG